MYTKIQVTFDAAEPEKLAEFWGLALGYVVEPPPEGFESWEDFAGSAGIPEADWGEVASRIDPAGEGPRLYFQRVPEAKTAKNRVHLDVRVAGREVRGERAQAAGQRARGTAGPGGRLAGLADRRRARQFGHAVRPGGQRVLRDLSGAWWS